MDDNWIIENLTGAFDTWNNKLTEIWSLVSESPQTFKGGAIWDLAVNINGALQAIGYGLLILFFAVSLFKSTANFRDFRRPEYALRFFIRFVAAKTAVTYGMDIMTTLFGICAGIISKVAGNLGTLTGAAVTLPDEIKTAVSEVGFLASIPLWLVTILGSVFITVLSFIMILTVYSRFFKLYMYTALAPIPLSTFAGETTSSTGKAFIKSYLGVCLEGAIIVLACLIFSAFTASGSPGIVDSDASAVTMVWGYLAETIFNMLVLVGLVKGADRIVKEMLAL
ncbi:MAG: hypothetical protein VB064_01915 [Oscillospiraceae bacterium]|nr:hypothetical protein [Oscillospiraceae bacterium]